MRNLLRKLLDKKKHQIIQTPIDNPDSILANSTDNTRLPNGIPQTQDGHVCIENNQVVVTNPIGSGSFAILWIPDDNRLSVTINDDKMIGDVFVTEEDTVSVHLDSRAPTRTFKVKIADDKLSVSVMAYISEGREHHLLDALQSRKALVEIVEHRTFPAPTPVQTLLDLLGPYSFAGQLDYESIDKLCHCTTNTETVVIRGTAPQNSTSGRYQAVNVREDLDYELRTKRYSSVSIGTTIAVYEAGLPGVPGIDVFGQEITIKNRDAKPELGNGVVQVKNYVVATRSGRPIFTRNKIDVVPELFIDHDLTSEKASISFDGCVVIRGSVMDGACVKATGSITIYGSVLQSTILGESSVHITNNAVGSKITAGHSQITYRDLLSLVQGIHTELDQFYADYTAVTAKARNRFGASNHIHMLPDILLKQRYPHLEENLHRFFAQYSQILMDIDEEYRSIAQVLRRSWQGIYRMNITNDHILQLMQLIQNYKKTLETSRTNTPGLISISEVSNSTLQASGNITVRGSGTFSSVLESRGAVKVAGNVRGGIVIASSAVSIGVLGSRNETETSVRVREEHGTVFVKVRHPNTLIDVGGRYNRNLVVEENIRFIGNIGFDKVHA